MSNKITTTNRRTIFDGLIKLAEQLEELPQKGQVEISEPIILKTNSRKVEANLVLQVETAGITPNFPNIRISIKKGEDKLSHRLIAFYNDKSKQEPYILVTGRVDTTDELPKIGLGSGLLIGSEKVLKKVVMISPEMKNETIIEAIKDGTNSPLHAMPGWSGKWANRMGFKEDKEREDYYFKTIQERK